MSGWGHWSSGLGAKAPSTSRWHSTAAAVHSTDRLGDFLVSELRRAFNADDGDAEVAMQWARDLYQRLAAYEDERRLLVKLADTGRVVSVLEQAVETTLAILDVTDVDVSAKWRQELMTERQERASAFNELLNDGDRFAAELGDETQQLELLALMKHGMETYAAVLSPQEQSLISASYDALSGVVVVHTLDWFATNERDWSGAVRSDVSAGEEACLRQVAVWVRLHHPHVRKLFGACYVGSPYVIHELSLSSFPDIPTWRFLRGCALGLEYVHERGLTHENLSLSTLHSSYEFKGMLTGLGLVRIDDSTAEGGPSAAADMYAFGHTMFEFITDRLGPNEDESSQLPSEQPYYVNDVVWKLLGRLCADDPADRIGMLEAAHVIEDIEKDDRDDFWDDEDSAQPAAELVDDLDSYVIQSADQTVAEILEQVDDLCDDVAGFIDINRAVYGRLVDVRDQLVAAGPLPIELLEDFSSILWRFYLVLEQRSASEFSAVATICAAETVANRNYGLHHSLDRLILCTPELSSASSIHNWRSSWKETRQRQQSKLHSYMECPIENLASLQAESPENMALLCFEASCRSFSSLSQVGLPVWFIPPHQVEFGKHLADGAFGAVSLGKWFDTDVIVKQVLTNQADTENREQFLQEVTLWSSLNHDNLIKMYGACHEGQPFFMCERANQGTLIEYLASRGSFQAWWSIWEAAKGLQHLHEHGIIHGDLKGNNILVCDGVAKLADFGLSTFANSVNGLGATGALGAFRWKAPECLRGSSPSFASDIYSFAMCFIEAVGGEFPWGNSMADQVVQYKVVQMKQLPPRPKNFTDAQWHLVTRMCAFEPDKRPTAAAVVHLVWKVKTVS